MLAFRVMNAALASIVTALTFSFRSRLALQAEILALRHQLNVLRRSTDARRKLRNPGMMFNAPPAGHGLAEYIQESASATAKRRDCWRRNVKNLCGAFVNAGNSYLG